MELVDEVIAGLALFLFTQPAALSRSEGSRMRSPCVAWPLREGKGNGYPAG